MSVNGITNAAQVYEAKSAAVKNKNSVSASETKRNETEDIAVSETMQNGAVDTAAVYEKSESTDAKKIYRRDDNTVEKLLAEAEKRAQSFRELVQKMLHKQGQVYTEATDIYSLLREGKVEVDPETRAQAQRDIAEDGYWGVNQTSDRLISFAKALTGGDPSKADEMIKAVKKGYEEAMKAWGGELPDISKQTLEAAVKKLEDWRDGKDTNPSMTDAATNAFTNQAATSAIK